MEPEKAFESLNNSLEYAKKVGILNSSNYWRPLTSTGFRNCQR